MPVINNRKTTPKVKGGKVQKKNRHQWTEFEGLLDGDNFTTIKLKAEEGYTHVVDRKKALHFVELIPDWKECSKGLSALVLDSEGSTKQTDKNYYPKSYNSIWLPPFPLSMELSWSKSFAETHKSTIELLGVKTIVSDDGNVVSQWTQQQAQAWQLLHLFLYDLYCHSESMSQGKDEYVHDSKMAEEYAVNTANKILYKYEKVIGKFF